MNESHILQVTCLFGWHCYIPYADVLSAIPSQRGIDYHRPWRDTTMHSEIYYVHPQSSHTLFVIWRRTMPGVGLLPGSLERQKICRLKYIDRQTHTAEKNY